MKTKLVVVLFMLLISFFAKAQKTYRQDVAACQYKGERIQIELKTFEQFTPSQDNDYGDVVMIRHQRKDIKVDLRNQGIGRYAFLKTYNEYCAKLLALPIKDDEVAFFLMKDNRPFADQVMVLYYNIKTQESEIMPTKLHARSAFLKDGVAYLKVAKESSDDKYGTVLIGNEKFNYIEKTFEPWVSFDGKTFKLDREVTLQKFEHKNLLSPSLLETVNEFNDNKFKIAVNPLLKKNCISLNGSQWVCN